MADKHQKIVWQIITDWTKHKKGRLYCCNQGLAFPARKDKNGETVPSQFPLWFGPLKRKFKGFPDLFGFEMEIESDWVPPVSRGEYPRFTTVEVKTKNDPIRKDQIRVMTGLVEDFGCNCYIAKENEEGYSMFLFVPNKYIKRGYKLEKVKII